MHWVIRMSRAWASATKAWIRSTYCGPWSASRDAAVVSVISEV
jgi:hypothetical protein